MASQNDVDITIRLESKEAKKNAEDLDKSIDKLGTTAQSSTNKASTSFKGFASAAGVAIGAVVSSTALLAAKLIDLAGEGEKLGSITDMFEKLGGTSASLEKARQASLGLLTEVELLAAANKAMLMGLPDVETNFAKIAEAGVRLGNALGVDAKDKVLELTQAIAKGEMEQLRASGIIIDQGKAYEEYAKKIGTTADKLTESQRVSAKQSAALSELDNMLARTAVATDSVANAQASLGNTITNTLAKVGLTVNQNESLRLSYRYLEDAIIDNESALGDLANFFATTYSNTILGAAVVLEILSQNWQYVVESFYKGAKILSDTVMPYVENFQRGLDVIGGKMKSLGQALGVVAEDIGGPIATKIGANLAAGAKVGTDAIGKLGKGASDTVGRFSELYDQMIKYTVQNHVTAKASRGLTDEVGKQADATVKTGDAVADLVGKNIDLNESGKKVEERVKREKEEFEKLLDTIQDLTGQSARSKGIKELEAQLSSLFKQGGFKLQTEEAAKALDELAKSFQGVLSASDIAQTISLKIKDIELKTDKKGKEVEGFGAMLLKDFFSIPEGTEQQINEQLAGQVSSIASNFLSGLADYINTGEVNKEAMGQTIGAIIGGILGAWFGGALGSVVGMQIGGTAGGFFGTIWDKMMGATQGFGSLARRALEKEINDALQASPIQIRLGDELFVYDWLTLPDKNVWQLAAQNGAGTLFDEWAREMQAREPEVYSVYQAVFGAMGQNLFQDFGVGAQVGVVLMDQFGDSIDNLRLLVQVLDVSFEELQQGITDAFLSGQIGALEAASALRDLPKAFEPGLEAFGDMTGAMNNLIQSAGRGRTAIKSLQDLAIEAMEGGAQTLDDLREHLLASGQYTEEQINNLFGALAQNGIGSLEQLAEVNDQTAIMILGALEASGGFFAEIAKGFEEAITQADNLQARLDTLDNFSAETQLTVKVRTEYMDSGAEAALNQVDKNDVGARA